MANQPIRLVSEGTRTRVFIGNNEVRMVTKVGVRYEVGAFPVLLLEIRAAEDLIIEADEAQVHVLGHDEPQS
jgi:hypothetical protein